MWLQLCPFLITQILKNTVLIRNRYIYTCIVAVVQSPSYVLLFATPWATACLASLSLTVSWSLPKFMSIESVMISSHLILCHSLLLLPSTFPSIRIFSNELALCITWRECWSFSLSPSNEYSGMISFKIDWFDLQGTLKSLLQHHISKASIYSLGRSIALGRVNVFN